LTPGGEAVPDAVERDLRGHGVAAAAHPDGWRPFPVGSETGRVDLVDGAGAGGLLPDSEELAVVVVLDTDVGDRGRPARDLQRHSPGAPPRPTRCICFLAGGPGLVPD